MKPFLSLTFDELTDAVEQVGIPRYRAKQLADWVYAKGVTDPVAMTNLPTDLVERLKIMTSRVASRADSTDGTLKLLLELADGQHTECVLIPEDRRATACVSTQVGCAMGCSFCASGLGGLKRNLTGPEILEQVLHLRQAAEKKVTHVVFMGIGEPLANLDATIEAIRALVDPQRFGISARHITVSTIGLPKQIRTLAREDIPITLAISLHAPNDALRQQLIPAAARTSITDILTAGRDFFQARKREVTLEYVMLAGVNDTGICADALVKLAKQLRCNVNLIRYNPVESLPYLPSTSVAIKAFMKRLRTRGVNAHLRISRGSDIAAACGQLRLRQAQADDASEASR